MQPTLYNTLTRTKEPVSLPKDRPVKLFVCGPTVYNSIHAGNARSFLVFDLFARTLKLLGHDVEYLQNITDIDDKIIKRAAEEKKSAEEVAHTYEAAYKEAMGLLGVTSVSRYERATDHIPEIISQISTLIEKGHAYAAEGNVYFSTASFPDYGKLSGQRLDKLESNEEERAPGKKSPHDFTLWKAYKEGEPFWDSPWGKGRPGWHIEDTAIASKYFGDQYDIHGGGLDLIFPHHECEVAQAEAASGKKPYVQIWMHNGHLTVRGEKMSKSLGNFITVQELLDTYDPSVIRLALLSAHYRSGLDYSENLMSQAEENLERILECVRRIESYSGTDDPDTNLALKAKQEFIAALSDDVNAPAALAAVYTLIREINKKLDAGTPIDKTALLEFFQTVDSVFGLMLFRRDAIPEEILDLVSARETARAEKNWTRSDELRAEIEAKGYELKDTKEGPTLRKI